jgi:tetratricopeptide (TPR) repeat protein
MVKQNYDLAEQFFRKAVEAHETDHPSLIYNLITVDLKRGKDHDAEARLEDLTKQFPDYFFAAATLATIKARTGDIETASRLTERFYEKTKWHTLEARAWFYMNMELALAEKKFDGARSWLDMLARFDQGVDVDYWEDHITRNELADRLSGFSSGGGKPRKGVRKKRA